MKRIDMFASINFFAFVLLLGSSAAAQTFQQTENFDTDPCWDGHMNLLPFNTFVFTNEYGFQPDVDIAGGTDGPLGVAGGKISRSPISYYADNVGSLDPSTTPLTASGDAAIRNCSAQGNMLVGWFDKDSPLGWETEETHPDAQGPLRHFIGFRTDQDFLIEVMILGNDKRCEPATVFVDCDSGDCCTIPLGETWSFDISYDPNGGTAGPGGTGEGSVTGTFNISGTEYTTTIDIEAGQRDSMNNFNRFGILSQHIPQELVGQNNNVRAHIDNLEYTSGVTPTTATGACNLAESCEILTEACCLAQDGTYDGDGTECQMDFNIPGDCNQDGAFDLSDVVHFLGFLFQGTPAALPCSTDEANLALMDCNLDGGLDLSDAVYKLAFLFQGGPPPPEEAGCTVIPNCPHNQACP
jgi:hypothetical protein